MTLRRLAQPRRKMTRVFEMCSQLERFVSPPRHPLCLRLKAQHMSTVAASVVTTGAIGPSAHLPDEAPAGLSLSSQRVRLKLSTSTQRSILQSEWVVFFFSVLSLPDHDFETSVRFHFHFHHHEQIEKHLSIKTMKKKGTLNKMKKHISYGCIY